MKLSKKLSALLCASAMSSSGVLAAEEPVNVLWIIAEDMSREQGAYGYGQEVATPNIDALAKRGMVFDNVFTTAPICSPSRSAIMTGVYQTTLGAHHHRTPSKEKKMLEDGIQPISQIYQQAGYFTANIENLTGNPNETFLKGTGKRDWNFKHKGKAFEGKKWSQLSKKQPFYAQVNMAETHRMLSDWSRAHEHITSPADPNRVLIPPYYPEHPEVKEDWAKYLNSVMALDEKVGYVLNKLEQDGLADNTIVYFFSDHGQAMVRGKQWVYDSGLRIPFIVYVPESIKVAGYEAGTRSDRLISGIDFAPTALAMSGIDIPKKMQGVPFLAAETDEHEYVFSARDRADESYEYIRSVRDKQFRYIKNFMPNVPRSQPNGYREHHYPTYNLMRNMFNEGKLNDAQAEFWLPSKPTEELYDLVNDPFEINNLANNPDYEKHMTRFRKALDQWQVETKDKGCLPK